MFDISKLAILPTATIELKHPVTFEPLADGKKVASVVLKSKAHPDYRKAAIAYVNAIKGENVSDEQRDAAALEFLKSAVIGFENINATVDNLADPQYMWLREQVDSALGSVGNFLPK